MPRVTLHSEADASAPSDPHSASAPARDATPAPAPTREDPVAASGAVAPSDAHASMVEVFLRLPEAVVLVDGSGTIVWGNPSAERIFERTLEDWAGQSALDLIHPDDREFALRALSSILDKDVGTPIEMRVNAASGWRLVELVGTTTQWLGDPVILCSMRDLTERRRYELASGREARFRSLVHNAGSVMMLVSESGRIESVSSVITRLLGHDHELLERRHLCEIVAPEDRPALQSALDTARRGATAGHPVTARIRLLRHGSAGTVPFELHMVNLLDDPTVEGIVLTAHDATAQVSAELNLVDALSRLTATLDSTADGILVVDTAGKITDFNGRFVEIWGIPDDAVVRKQDVSSLEFALDQLTDPEDFLTRLRELRLQPETETFDLLTFKDGRVIERFSKPQCIAGVSVGRVYSFRDITDRKRLEDELSFWAFHDSLTGLANNALFQDRLQHALSRLSRAGSHLAILYLDLDDFKTVNDSLGHGEGDRLLRKVASTLCDLLRPSDTAARLGGDEFAVFMTMGYDHPPLHLIVERFLEAARRAGVKWSIGATPTPSERIVSLDDLLTGADEAMYRGRRARRGDKRVAAGR